MSVQLSEHSTERSAGPARPFVPNLVDLHHTQSPETLRICAAPRIAMQPALTLLPRGDMRILRLDISPYQM